MTFWEDKVAVVTGGSSGIGRASALLFAERGARVVVADLNEEAGRKTVKEVGGPERAIFVPVDTTSQEDLTKLVQVTIATFGRVDILHNNAAVIERYDHIENEPIERFRRVIDVNLNALFISCKAVVPHMRRQRGGTIVNMSSMGAIGSANLLAYSSAKAGVLALTRGLAQQLSADRIRVNALMPGLVETPMTADGPAIERARRNGLPVIQPDEMARAVAYAAEHEELTGALLQYVPTQEGARLGIMQPWTWEPLEL